MKQNKKTNVFTVDRLGAWSITLGVVSALIGFWIKTCFPSNIWTDLVRDFYPNVSTDFLTIGFGILVIDRLNQKRNTENEKRSLISQLGSSFNILASDAARRIRDAGWKDELEDISLYRANLENAELQNFNLKGANLTYGKFKNINLNGACLDNSEMYGADLSDAGFDGAFLRAVMVGNCNPPDYIDVFKNAHFIEADLTGAIFLGVFDGITTASYHPFLRVACSLNGTIMPNGQRYNGCYNLKDDLIRAAFDRNIKDPEAMAEFYNVSLDKYLQGQIWHREYKKYLSQRKSKARALCAKQGLNWDKMNEDDRGSFIDLYYKEP